MSLVDDQRAPREPYAAPRIRKRPTGIEGFDEISGGGLPDGRLVTLMGAAGTGKTVFALQTLVDRARLFGEAGIFVSFEEPLERFRENASGFSWDFAELEGSKIAVFDARLSPDTVINGEFDFVGILAQLTALLEKTNARTIVFDGISMVFSCLPEIESERRELTRIDNWLSQNSVGCLMTGRPASYVPRDEMRRDYFNYISDMIIDFCGELHEGAFTRSIRIVKYRGSDFATNAFPVVISEDGIQVVAKPTARMTYPTFDDRISSGVPGLDGLLTGGYWRGTVILVSGAPGTTKTNLACHFVAAACDRGERVVYFSLDESDSQIVHDVRSVGIDLESHRTAGRLVFLSLRAASRSPEAQFVELRRLLDQHRPSCLVIDPISALVRSQYPFAGQICEMMLEEARSRGITTFCTSLAGLAVADQELSLANLSTIADTWIHVTFSNRGGERNRALTIIKSRGTAHSNQVRELVLSEKGLALVEVYTAEGEVLMGSARAQKEHYERERALELEGETAQKELALLESLATMEMQFEALQAQLAWKRKEVELVQTTQAARLENARLAAAERHRRREAVRDDAIL